MKRIINIKLDSKVDLPVYARIGDAGADLCCSESLTLAPFERKLVGTGVYIALPDDCVGLITPRSGNAWRHGLSIVNSPGIVDSGYRGEIKVCLINLDNHDEIRLSAGDRIAQLVVMPFITAIFNTVSELDQTERGSGGYGSTGSVRLTKNEGNYVWAQEEK